MRLMQLKTEMKALADKYGMKVSEIKFGGRIEVKLSRDDINRIKVAINRADGEQFVIRHDGEKLRIWTMAGYKAICKNAGVARQHRAAKRNGGEATPQPKP